MKIEKSNNPAAVGVLVLVLVLIVGRILWMVFGHGGPMAAAATVSANSGTRSAQTTAVTKAVTTTAVTKAVPTMAEAPAPEAAGDSPVVTTITTRNPFSVAVRPALAVSRLGGLPHLDAVHRATTDAGVVPLTFIPPFPVRLKPETGVMRLQAPHGLAAPPPHLIAVQAEALLTLKLTATVGGTEPLAIVQTTDPEPVILHVGDSLAGMLVVAIHEQDVVFARGNGFWTLPLQSAQSEADGVAADAAPVTALPPAPQPVISIAPLEEKTDDQEQKQD